MSLTAEQVQGLKKAVRQLVRAEIAASMKSTLTDPIDVELVEEELTGSRIRFGGMIARLSDGQKKIIVVVKKAMDAPGPDLNKKDPE